MYLRWTELRLIHWNTVMNWDELSAVVLIVGMICSNPGLAVIRQPGLFQQSLSELYLWLSCMNSSESMDLSGCNAGSVSYDELCSTMIICARVSSDMKSKSGIQTLLAMFIL